MPFAVPGTLDGDAGTANGMTDGHLTVVRTECDGAAWVSSSAPVTSLTWLLLGSNSPL